MAPRTLAASVAVLLLGGCADLTGVTRGDRPPYVVAEALKTYDLPRLRPEAMDTVCRENRNYLQTAIPPWEEYRPWWAYAFAPRADWEVEREEWRICRPLFEEIIARFDPDLPPSPPGGFTVSSHPRGNAEKLQMP
ncbi:MAG TPA: hypothetical protein VEB64_01955 [Azospirillaceae bacterium]|nr:hypothetical protein [Azospirillaceae bacterium]